MTETQPRPDEFVEFRATIRKLLRYGKATVDEITDVAALEVERWENIEHSHRDLDEAYLDIKGVESWLLDNADNLYDNALTLRAHDRGVHYTHIKRAYDALGVALGELSEVV
jgi:hypothetical protein